MGEMFQEYDERQRREPLYSFLSMDDPRDNFGDRERNDFRQQHPSRIPDTEVDVVMVPRRFSSSRRTNKMENNYAQRQNLIKRGRALIQRGRESKQETSADVASVVSSFSVDDGSYKDDLRRSIREEESSRTTIIQPKYRERNYRKLKSDLGKHEEENTSMSTSSTSRDNNDHNISQGHLPLKKKVEREATHTRSSKTTTGDAAHSMMETETVSSRIRMWEQGTVSASSGKSMELDDDDDGGSRSASTEARQRTEERLLYLKQWLKDRDAQNASATLIPSNSAEIDVTGCISLASPHSKYPMSTRSNGNSKNEDKQIFQVIQSPQETGTIGISSGFPFPQDADIIIVTSCNVSEVTTTVSSKEHKPSEKSNFKAMSQTSDVSTTSESQDPSATLQVTKSLDGMNQMLPKPKVSRPPTELKSIDSSNEKNLKFPVSRYSKTPASQSMAVTEKKEHGYISSAHRNSEPLRSLLDSDTQEDSSIDRPAINIVESFEQETNYPLDEPPSQVESMPVRATYSKMSTLPFQTSSSNSDGIRTIARESREGKPSSARSIGCVDSDSNKSPREEKPNLNRPEKAARAGNHIVATHPSSPVVEAKSGKIDDNVPRETTNIQAKDHNDPVQSIPLTSKTGNKVIDDFKPLESDQVIVEVASTLTDSMQGGKFAASRKTSKLLSIREGDKSVPSLRRSKRALVTPDGDYSVDMSVSYKEGISSDSKKSVTETDELIWRLDPLDSLSDFILQIRDEESGKSNAYHVHKHRLACGPRKSAHLDKLFKERSTSSAYFSFCSKACEVFPSVLDFMYGDDFELEFTTTTVVIYRGIGYKLQISSLVAATTEFIGKDMQVANMTSYVSDMEVYGKLGMRKIMAEKCASKIEHISELDSLWIIMDPGLFRETVLSKSIDRTKNSQHLSILIAEYTALHKHEMTKEMFGKLTTSAVVPKIAREAALPLLEICFSYGSPRQFEGLQKRCALTMATYWKITNENDRQRLFALLRNLPSSFTVDFLEKVDTGKMTSLLNFSLSQEYQSAEGGPCGSDIEKEDTFSIDEAEAAYVGWRLDPDLSYSDWVIRVKSGSKSSADAYYVHKHVLAVGNQKSAFFASVFSSNRNQSITRGSTSVSLDQEAAQVFPRMLDFIYSKGKTLHICTQTILPLRFLARIFQVHSLNHEIIEFTQRDLCLGNVSQYLKNADSFNDKGITGIVVDFVAANIEEIDIDSELLDELEPSIFRRIISSEAIDHSASESYHIPILIAKYFYIHELDEKLLEDILGNYDTEKLDCLNALKLLQIICRLEMRESSFFLILRDKCTEVLTASWDDFRASFRNEVFAVMLTLDTETVAQIFDKVENRCYKIIETSDEMTTTLNVSTKDLKSTQNVNTPAGSIEFEIPRERKGGHIIMPPTSMIQFLNQEHPENRQPESTDHRPSFHTMPSAPSEEMRASTALSAPSEEMRFGTMATLPSKELCTSTLVSSPSAQMLVNKDTGSSESCQIFSCGFMTSE